MTWLRRIRGAIGMGFTWAAIWMVGGLLIGVSSKLLPGLPWDSFFEVFDAPLPALAIPGFAAGALFSVVLGIAGRRRRFHELSLSRFAAWGAVGGLLAILFPFALVAVGLASTEGGKFEASQILSAIAGPFVLLSVVSATGTLMLARRAEGGESRTTSESVAAVELAACEAQERLGGGDLSLHGHSAASSAVRVRPDSARGPGDA